MNIIHERILGNWDGNLCWSVVNQEDNMNGLDFFFFMENIIPWMRKHTLGWTDVHWVRNMVSLYNFILVNVIINVLSYFFSKSEAGIFGYSSKTGIPWSEWRCRQFIVRKHTILENIYDCFTSRWIWCVFRILFLKFEWLWISINNLKEFCF